MLVGHHCCSESMQDKRSPPSPLFNGPDNWMVHESVSYKFQQAQVTRRLPHSTRQSGRGVGTQPNNAPDIVVLSLWSQATEQQFLHYSLGYRTLYPTTKVVQLRNNAVSHDAALHELVEPRKSTGTQTVMLHLFGTSGATSACRLLRGYKQRTGRLLDVKAVVADTEPSPSIATFFTSSEPISSALFAIVLAFWMAVQQYVWFWPPDLHAGQIHHDLNNPSLLPKEARKCFIFAQRGLMLTWMQRTLPRTKLGEQCTTVDFNDEPDERREYAIRRSSIDERGRWSGDQERYWAGIEGVWEGR